MLRSSGNTNARVCGYLMTKALVGRPDRIENLCDQVGHLSWTLDRGLNNGEFVATQPGDKVGAADAAAQAHSDRF